MKKTLNALIPSGSAIPTFVFVLELLRPALDEAVATGAAALAGLAVGAIGWIFSKLTNEKLDEQAARALERSFINGTRLAANWFLDHPDMPFDERVRRGRELLIEYVNEGAPDGVNRFQLVTDGKPKEHMRKMAESYLTQELQTRIGAINPKSLRKALGG